MATEPEALPKSTASSAEAKVLEMASLKPSARRVSRRVLSWSLWGSSMTVPVKVGSVSANLL